MNPSNFRRDTNCKTLATFNLSPFNSYGISYTSFLLKLVDDRLTDTQLVDLRYWNGNKPLNGISMIEKEVDFLIEKISKPEIQPDHFKLEDRYLLIMKDPVPLLLQVQSENVNAVLLEPINLGLLKSTLPTVRWMLEMKKCIFDYMLKDILQILTAIKCAEKFKERTGNGLGMFLRLDIDTEIKRMVISESIKVAVSQDFCLLKDFFALTTEELKRICEEFFETVQLSESRIKQYITEANHDGAKDTSIIQTDVYAISDFLQLQKLLTLIGAETNHAKNARKRKRKQ